MSHSPRRNTPASKPSTPTPRSTTPPTPSESGGTTSTSDWRKSITQQYRSAEISDIAKVLASLDSSSAPSSKLMLASRFEQSIFASAVSLQDYRKKITKRLKRMQRNFVGGDAQDSTAVIDKDTKEEEEKKAITDLEFKLRSMYGKQLLFVVQNAALAVATMAEKSGKEKAYNLKQHTDNAEQWAVEIGVVPENTLVITSSKGPSNSSSSSSSNKSIGMKRMKKCPRTLKDVEHVGMNIKTRLENIRSHVAKLTKFDLFLEECLVNLNVDDENGSSDFLVEACLAVMEREGISLDGPKPASNPVTGMALIKSWAEKAIAPVPITRTAAEEKDVSLLYMEKMRAAAQVLMLYTTAVNNSNQTEGTSAGKTAVDLREYLKKAHNVAEEACNYLAQTYRKHNAKALSKKESVLLEDAWNKVMEYSDDNEEHSSEAEVDQDAPTSSPKEDSAASTVSSASSKPNLGEVIDISGNDDEDWAQPQSKKQRTLSPVNSVVGNSSSHITTPLAKPRRSYPPVLRTKVLFTTGRKTPYHLLNALKRKRAEIYSGEGKIVGTTRIRLKFGNAFEMQVFFSPLLVAIRALPSSSKDSSTTNNDTLNPLFTNSIKSQFRKEIVDGGLATWTSSRYGLETPVNPMNVSKVSNFERNIMVGSGTNATIGPIVAKRLEYASAQATRVLRRCFSDLAGKAYVNTSCDSTTAASGTSNRIRSDFDIEMLEGTALMKFIGIARSTYQPDWVDDDL